MKTNKEQIYTFGEHMNSGCSFQYLGSTPSHIVFESVPYGEHISKFGIATTTAKPSPEPEPCISSQPSPPLDIDGLYCWSASLHKVQCIKVHCLEGSCVGIMIIYSTGLQQPLGQCRPDAIIHKVDKPFSFHHWSKEDN